MKSEIDWPGVEKRVRAGEAFRAIARDLKASGTPISHVAIKKRSDKEGWLPSAQSWKQEVRAVIPGNHSGHDHAPVMFNKDSPETRASILADLERGLTFKSAAEKNGISDDTLKRWRDGDEEFAGQCQKAIQSFVARQVQRIEAAGERGDWKAPAYLLERHPQTREDYGQALGKGGGPQIIVQLNIARAGDGPEPIELEATVVKE